MKLIVLVKETIDLNSIDVAEDEYLPKEFERDEIILNPNDKHAIEMALTLKEELGGDPTVKVICLGSEHAVKILREAIAMGCDEAAHVNAEELEFLTSYAKAKVLAEAVRKEQADLVFTGMYSEDFGQAQIPAILAAEFGWPQVTYANTLEVADDSVTSERYVEGGSIKVKVPRPCVVSTASTANEPRYTSVKRILKAKKTTIPVVELDDLGLDGESLVGTGGLELVEVVEPEVEETECFKVEEDDLEEGVDKLLAKLKEDGIDLSSFRE